MTTDEFMNAAIEEAKKGLAEGGIPIGSVLVLDGKIIGRGHNQRIQKSSAILHAEMDCIENAGRLTANQYKKCTIYSTLSPLTSASLLRSSGLISIFTAFPGASCHHRVSP